LGEKHVPRLFESARDSPLMLGRKPGVLAGQDLTGVRDITDHSLGIRERDLSRSGSLLLLVGGAHFEKTVSVKTLLKRSRHD